MARGRKPDPYDGFRDDRERRRALNTRVRSIAAVGIVAALAQAPISWAHAVGWLLSWLSA